MRKLTTNTRMSIIYFFIIRLLFVVGYTFESENSTAPLYKNEDDFLGLTFVDMCLKKKYYPRILYLNSQRSNVRVTDYIF